MQEPLPLALPPHPPLLTCPSCLIWHLCLGVLWWNAARPLSLRRCSLLAAIHFASIGGAVAERPVTGWEVGGGQRVESRFKGQWLRNQGEVMQLLSITGRCAHFTEILTRLPAYCSASTWLSSETSSSSSSSSSSMSGRERKVTCLYLDTARESQMLLSGSLWLKPCSTCIKGSEEFQQKLNKHNLSKPCGRLKNILNCAHERNAASRNVTMWNGCNLPRQCVTPSVI